MAPKYTPGQSVVTRFNHLHEALQFVYEHGGPVKDHHAPVPGYQRETYSDMKADAWVQLADGCFFGCVAEHDGPLSEVTPDEATYVYWIGIVPSVGDMLKAEMPNG